MTVILKQYRLSLGMQYIEVQAGIDHLLTGSDDCIKHWRAQLSQTDKYTGSRRSLCRTEA